MRQLEGDNVQELARENSHEKVLVQGFLIMKIV